MLDILSTYLCVALPVSCKQLQLSDLTQYSVQLPAQVGAQPRLAGSNGNIQGYLLA